MGAWGTGPAGGDKYQYQVYLLIQSPSDAKSYGFRKGEWELTRAA